MPAIPDFNETERHLVASTVRERFGKEVEVLVADAEIRMHEGDRELTEVPILYWQERECHFVIFKIDDSRYRNQFFYSVKDQFGTGREEYDDLGDCVLTLLRVQADHEAMRSGSA